ncbi:TetR family transcriptional regulator [Nisaea acidiphila]|uniref:TetR family transcriptional regulator n=1 Tax=Nisaea acidiphila TaxID=1862145 RepID=A0A9J7ANI6_9PROT|nr:TetR/AcrR family transcriptional regulator [Nisaea acidiphila]UUX48726.1 TetR family transcriptional regulator [Nisaea acidiphila]
MSKELPDFSKVTLENISLRRMPSQARSRARVEQMLNCAISVIAEKGSEAMTMSEVARLADVSIGSLYQYFPDKSAIIRALAEHYGAECLKCIQDGLATAGTPDDLCTALGELIDVYFALFQAEPVIRDICSGTEADKTLRDMEIAKSRESGAVLSEALCRVAPGCEPERVAVNCFLIMHLGESTMRLALAAGPGEGRELVEVYKRMALAELRQLAE